VRRRAGTVVAVAAGLAVAVSVPAWAYVAVTAQTGVDTTAGTLGAPAEFATRLQASDLDDGRTRLSWAAPAGIAPSSYTIERQPLAGPWVTVTPSTFPTCPAGACTAIDGTATPGTSFRYRVSAKRGLWASPPSAVRLAASLVPTSATALPDSAQLAGIAATGAGGVAVGEAGTVLACASGCTTDTGSRWRRAAWPTSHHLRAVALPSASDAWVVGDRVVLHCTADCTATAPTVHPVVAAETLLGSGVATGVAAAGDDVALVAGRRLLYSTDGGTRWADGTAAIGAPTGTTLLAVAGADAHQLLVTGTGGFAARCVLTAPASCGDPGTTFTVVSSRGDLRSVAWDTGDSTYLGVDTHGHLWRGTPGPTDVSWAADPADSGVPIGARGATSAAGHVWAVADPGSSAPGASGIRHFHSSGWATQATSSALDETALAATGSSVVTVPARAAGTLPSTCAAPALLATVEVPAGPTPPAGPAVSAWVTASGPTGLTAAVLASTDGVAWSAAETLDLTVVATSVAFSGLAWTTTSARTLHLCIVAAGGDTLTVDALRVGVQE
jgi:hypothetical protein